MAKRCKLCGQVLAGKFCAQCGAPVEPENRPQKIRRWAARLLAVILVGLVALALWPFHAEHPGLYVAGIAVTLCAGILLSLIAGQGKSQLRTQWNQLARELRFIEVFHQGPYTLKGQYEGYNVRVFCSQRNTDPPQSITHFELDFNTEPQHKLAVQGKAATAGLGFLEVVTGDAYFDENYGFRGLVAPSAVAQIMTTEVRNKLDRVRTSRAFTGVGIPDIVTKAKSIVYEAPGHVEKKEKLREHLDALVAMAKACEKA